MLLVDSFPWTQLNINLLKDKKRLSVGEFDRLIFMYCFHTCFVLFLVCFVFVFMCFRIFVQKVPWFGFYSLFGLFQSFPGSQGMNRRRRNQSQNQRAKQGNKTSPTSPNTVHKKGHTRSTDGGFLGAFQARIQDTLH